MSALLIRSAILWLTLQLLVGAAGAWAGPPTEIVRQVIEKSLDILKNPAYQEAGKAPEGQGHRGPALRLPGNGQALPGTHLGKPQRRPAAEFVQLFSQLLEASYSDKIEKYAQRVKIDYTGEILSGDNAEVRTVVVKANDRIPLNYRLLNEGGTWKVYDVVIEGVSLVSNYRSQFSRIIHESSYAELVRRLKTKVSELQRTG